MPHTVRPVELPALETTLRVDAMYLRAARASLESAAHRKGDIDKARRKVAVLNSRYNRALKKHHGDAMAAYNELEPICIQMESAEFSLGEAHAPQLRDLAAVQILATAALESHINIRAAEKLSRRQFSRVERMPLMKKWLTVPRLLNLPGFVENTAPYQTFQILVQYRNSLVHYKPCSEQWQAPGVPRFLVNLGLTPEAASKSLNAACKMIATLAKQLGERKPYWLGREDISYFEIRVD